MSDIESAFEYPAARAEKTARPIVQFASGGNHYLPESTDYDPTGSKAA
ncbi:hypothetical protein [Neorhizobium sp. NCHU2750]